jgi:hypothetical protein
VSVALPIEIQKNPDALRLLTLEEFVQRPAIRFYVRNLIPSDSIVIVFGPPKGGKTFSVCDLTMHAAHGLPWYGYQVSKPVRVAYMAGEGTSGLKVRLHAWLQEHDNIEEPGLFRILPEALSLPERVDEVIEALREFKPDVVVADTVNAYFGAGDENSTQDMTAFCNAVRRIKEELGCTVLVIHHTGHGDQSRERGSIALRASADVLIQVAKDTGGSGNVGFQVAEARDMETWPEALALRLKRVETDWKDDDGQPLATCVVESADSHVTLTGRGQPLGKVQQILHSMCVSLAKKRELDENGEAMLIRADVVKALDGMADRRSVSMAWPSLQARGLIRLVEPGSVAVKMGNQNGA